MKKTEFQQTVPSVPIYPIQKSLVTMSVFLSHFQILMKLEKKTPNYPQDYDLLKY